jgi:hypothetical protein
MVLVTAVDVVVVVPVDVLLQNDCFVTAPCAAAPKTVDVEKVVVEFVDVVLWWKSHHSQCFLVVVAVETCVVVVYWPVVVVVVVGFPHSQYESP